MASETIMLMIANMVVLAVMTLAYVAASRGRVGEPFWTDWAIGNAALAVALGIFAAGTSLPLFISIVTSNTLLVFGCAMRWRAARRFGGRSDASGVVYGATAVVFAAASVGALWGVYRPAFLIANPTLAILSAMTAYEFWRDRGDALPSRYGLVASYALIAASFAARFVQGAFYGSGQPLRAPDDERIQIHLILAVVHAAASGAFALSLAYERNAAALRRAATHDHLTGLLNRRAFDARLRETIEAPDGKPFALVLFDLDHFKRVNDLHGHAGGDEALRVCAARISEALPAGAIAARVGGEEFAALLPGVGRAEAIAAAEALGRTIREARIEHDGRAIALTMSAGVRHSDDGPREFNETLRAADAALYAAKREGRDRVAARAA